MTNLAPNSLGDRGGSDDPDGDAVRPRLVKPAQGNRDEDRGECHVARDHRQMEAVSADGNGSVVHRYLTLGVPTLVGTP